MRCDHDFDGREDYWESYKNGAPVSYRADNDRNGVPDEWGRMEKGMIVERNWTFFNDQTVDKRAFYGAGRKIREDYDRDRNGTFEEIIRYDEFERVLSPTAKRFGRNDSQRR
jgi:hypothetical protein